MAMNMPMLRITATDSTNAQNNRDFNIRVGLLSSALEHRVPESIFSGATVLPDAISAVNALSKANASGQRIYHITQLNQATVLPNIHHGPATMAEIQNALNIGKEVITHTDAVTVPGWSGAGYIILDPVTGDGAYKISGGKNGMVVALLLTVLSLVAALALATSGGALAAVIGIFLYFFDLYNAISWATSTVSANTEEEFNRLNAGQSLTAVLSSLPLLPFVEGVVVSATLTYGALTAWLITTFM